MIKLLNNCLLFATGCILFSFSALNAQCPTVSCPSALTLTNCASLGQTVTATANYSNNITSRWLAPGNVPIASIGTASSVALLNNAGTYTVEFKDNSSNCVVSNSIVVTYSNNITKPTFDLVASNFTPCVNSPIMLNIVNASVSNPFPGGPVSYTLLFAGSSTVISPGTLSAVSSYSLNYCGNIYTIVKENVNFCIASYDVAINCSSNVAVPITIAGNNTVCRGSSITFTASGATSYNWGSTPTLNIVTNSLSPTNNTVSVSGVDPNGCNTSGSFSFTVNNTCADVWPGDANSDGVVNSTDVLELGLWASSTGSARSFTSNAFSSQFANVWTGTVSTGKNRCHADCNGDGSINAGDNAAISANFNQSHSFKSSSSFSVSDMELVTNQSILSAGNWNKIDVMLGNSANTINQIYGLAFEINYDQSVIMPDSVYLIYTPSFLSAANQNIDFSKNYFQNGKLYAASVRVDGLNVNGNGKIAELYVKPKFNLPANSVLNLSVNNIQKIDRAAQLSSLSGGNSINVLIDDNALGLYESGWLSEIKIFPNPVKDVLNLTTNNELPCQYYVTDICGQQIFSGDFVKTQLLDLSGYSNGVYFIQTLSGSYSSIHKVVVNH